MLSVKQRAIRALQYPHLADTTPPPRPLEEALLGFKREAAALRKPIHVVVQWEPKTGRWSIQEEIPGAEYPRGNVLTTVVVDHRSAVRELSHIVREWLNEELKE